MPVRLNPDTAQSQFELDIAAHINKMNFAVRGATADVVANAADTYLLGLRVPQGMSLQAETLVRFRMYASKTAAGTATPIWVVRVGTAGTVADAAVLTFTGAAQTAAADNGVIEVTALLRNTGAAGVMAGGLFMVHTGPSTGMGNVSPQTIQVTSSGFDTTPAGLIVGLSVNPGAAGVWTHQLITGEILGL